MRIQRCSVLRAVFVIVLLSAGALFAELTESQRAWVAKLDRPLRVACPADFAPLSFRALNGKTVGVLPDFSRWIEDFFELDIDLIPAEANQLKEGVLSGRFDAAFLYTRKAWSDEKLILAPAFMRLSPAICVPSNSPINKLSIGAGAIVAVEPYSRELLEEQKTDFSLLPCANFREMMKAVQSGRADALISNSMTLDYYSKLTGKENNLRFVDESFAKGRIALCVQMDNQMLRDILDVVMAEAGQQKVVRVGRNKWVGTSGQRFRFYFSRYSRYVIVAIGVLLLAVLLFWRWDVRLTRRVQKKTQQLRNSEERLRTIFQHSPDAIFIESEAGVVLDVNPVACALHGLARDELIGKRAFDLVPAAHRERVKKDFPKWFTGEMTRCDGVAAGADGRNVPVEMIGAPLRYEGQSAVLLMVRDMTERNRVEQAQKESETRYRELIEVQANLIARLDPEGRFTFVNEALCRFLGRNRDELIGDFFHSFVYHEDLETPRQTMLDLLSGKRRTVSAEYRVRSITHVAWVQWEAAVICDEAGQVLEIQTVGHDVTETRRINEALRESEKRLRFLFEEIPHIAVQGYNGKHEIIFWNRASEQLYGYSRDEALGKRVEEILIPADRRSKIEYDINTWAKTGRPIPAGEEMKCRSDGQMVSVYSTRLATWNQRGEREMYVIDVDLSKLKRASEELVKARNAAERASQAKSEFLANMSHEIRTPMNGVMGLTSLLLDTDLDETQRDLAQTTLDSAHGLLRIIDDLLDISRIEAGEVRLQLEPFCLRETVKKVTALFADRAAQKGIDLKTVIAPDVPEKLMGDAGRIRQVLINLVGNALKFTQDGYIQIYLQAEKVEKGWNLIADVKDNGVGMSPELQRRVFDKFTQGDTSLMRGHGGVGLGLAISKQLVELMGGQISVVSEEGQGTALNFNIILPAMAKESPPEAEPPSAQKNCKLNAEILLVEDNQVNQKVATAMIKKLGCSVTVANNGAEALKMIPAQNFDLIFMDCQMPVMDGFETTRAVRQMTGEIRDIPIVAMTAHALKEDRQRCLDAGMDDYLAKPVHRGKLFNVLQKYCG